MNQKSSTDEVDLAFDQLLETHLASPMRDLVPSSGFASSVMENIRHQTLDPPPIPFPWHRTLPGLSTILGVFAVFILLIVVQPDFHVHLQTGSITRGEVVLFSAVVTVCLSIAVISASLRLTGGNR